MKSPTGPQRPPTGPAHAEWNLTGEPIITIDDHTVVARRLADAAALLADPASIAGWFGARHDHDRTLVVADHATVAFRRHHEQWQLDRHALIVDGCVDALRYHAHLTLRSVARAGTRGSLHTGTEIWVHIELVPAHAAAATTAVIRNVIRRGLEHLHLGLDTLPGEPM